MKNINNFLIMSLVSPLLAMAVAKVNGELMWLPLWSAGLIFLSLILLLIGLIAGLIFLEGMSRSWDKGSGFWSKESSFWGKESGFALLFLFHALLLFHGASILFTGSMLGGCFESLQTVEYSGQGGNFYLYNARLSPDASLSCQHSYSYSEIRRQSGFLPLADTLIYACNCRFDRRLRQVGDVVTITADCKHNKNQTAPDMQINLRTGELSPLKPTSSPSEPQ